MKYPHARYLKFLLSKKLGFNRVLDLCSAHLLPPPHISDLTNLVEELKVPMSQTMSFQSLTPEMRNWLWEKDLFLLWEGGREISWAFEIAKNFVIRQDFEALLTIHASFDTAYASLRQKYKDCPTQEKLEFFCYVFFDLSLLDASEYQEYITYYAKQVPHLAIRGTPTPLIDLGNANLPAPPFDLEVTLEKIINFGLYQIEAASKTKNLASGQQLMGLAAMGRNVLDAAEKLQKLRTETSGGTAGEGLAKEAEMFQLKKIMDDLEIPGIEDLRDENNAQVKPFPTAARRSRI